MSKIICGIITYDLIITWQLLEQLWSAHMHEYTKTKVYHHTHIQTHAHTHRKAHSMQWLCSRLRNILFLRAAQQIVYSTFCWLLTSRCLCVKMAHKNSLCTLGLQGSFSLNNWVHTQTHRVFQSCPVCLREAKRQSVIVDKQSPTWSNIYAHTRAHTHTLPVCDLFYMGWLSWLQKWSNHPVGWHRSVFFIPFWLLYACNSIHLAGSQVSQYKHIHIYP